MEYFTKEQVLLILIALDARLQKDPKSFTKKIEIGTVVYNDFATSGRTYISLSPSGGIYVSIEERASSVSPSPFFWKDKELKEIRDKLRVFDQKEKINSYDLIVRTFPEVIDTEFEQQFLIKK